MAQPVILQQILPASQPYLLVNQIFYDPQLIGSTHSDVYINRLHLVQQLDSGLTWFNVVLCCFMTQE